MEIKLTPTQWEMLTRAYQAKDGVLVAPGGYATAGRDAARFYATHRCLVRHGFTERAGEQSIRLTDAGRAAVKARLARVNAID